MPVQSNIEIEDARIGFRNFAGVAGKFNAEGQRNFCVFLEEDLGKLLEADGWNVRWLTPRDEEEVPQAYMQVAANFGAYPPRIVLITSKGKTLIAEEDVKLLDWAEIAKVDLVIRPYNWIMHKGTKNEKHGVKAYLKTLYVTVAEDAFESKYVDVPDSASNSLADYNSD